MTDHYNLRGATKAYTAKMGISQSIKVKKNIISMNTTLRKVTLYILLAAMILGFLTIILISFNHWDESLSLKRRIELFWRPSLGIFTSYLIYILIRK